MSPDHALGNQDLKKTRQGREMQIQTVAVFHCQASAVPASAWCCADGIVTTLAAMGYQVIDCGRPTLREVSIDVLQDADLIIMSGVDWFDHVIAERYGAAWFTLRAPKVAWFSESAHRDDGDFDYGRVQPLADLHYYPAAQDALEFGGRWLPFGADVEIFNPKAVDKIYGAAFLGTMYPKRAAYVTALQHPLELLPLVSADDPARSFELLAARYSATRIFVNLPSLSRLLVTKVTEVMACRTLLMTPAIDHPSGVANMDVFESGKHLIYYDPLRPESVGPVIAYYLAHPDEAEAIASAGFEEVRRAHTLRHRLETILADVQDILGGREDDQLPHIQSSIRPGINFHYISVGDGAERREAMERQAARLGLNITRFEALDTGSEMSGVRGGGLDGCLSHMGVIDGTPRDTYSVVLEEHVELAGIFSETVTPITLEAVQDYDIVFLECRADYSCLELLRGFHEVFRRGGGRPDSLTVLRPFTAYTSGSGAYVVTPRGKRTLTEVFAHNLRRTQPEWVIDRIYRGAILEGRLQAAIFAPFVASSGMRGAHASRSEPGATDSAMRLWPRLVNDFTRSLFVDIDWQDLAREVATIMPGLGENVGSPGDLQRNILAALSGMLAERDFRENEEHV